MGIPEAPSPLKRHRSTAGPRASQALYSNALGRQQPQKCERSRTHTNPSRHLLLEHLGRAPVEVPPHPARLTPVRRMAKQSGNQLKAMVFHRPLELSLASTFSGSSLLSSRDDLSDAGEGNDGVAATELMNVLMPFSAQCTGVMSSQTSVEAFSARKVFSACEFFDSCSLCFVRELVASGEPPLWQGISFDSGSVVYSEGELGATMYVVIRGQAEASAKDRGSRTFGPRDYFGEAQALGVLAKRQETVHAATPLHVLEVSCKTLTDLLRRKREADFTGTRPTDGSKVYAFAEERKYFERVAEDVYQSSTRRRRQRGRLAGGGFSRDDDQELAELANKLKAQLSKVGGSPRTMTQAAQLMGRQQSPRGGAGPLERRPQLPDPVAATSSATSSASALENPRAWRKRVEQAQAAMEGDTVEDVAAVLRFIEKLKASIRMDLRGGYKMPVDAVQAQNELGGTSKAKVDAWLDAASDEASDADEQTSTGSQHRGQQEPLEVVASDSTSAIDLRRLPPFRFMNTKQKHMLLQQLERQVLSRPSAAPKLLRAATTRAPAVTSLLSKSQTMARSSWAHTHPLHEELDRLQSTSP